MPRTKNGSLPSYRLYKRTGQAVVTIDGHDYYLGPYGSLESKQNYQRLIDAWLARKSDPEAPDHQPLPLAPLPQDAAAPSVNELILGFIRHAKAYYRTDAGGEQKEVGCIRDVLRIVRQLYGQTPAPAFGPKALKEVRATMIEKGWSRSYINHQVDRLRRMFRWAAEEQLLPASVYQALRTVSGLRKGVPGVRESKKVQPVPPRLIKPVLKRVPPMLQAVILFVRVRPITSLTG